MENVAKTNTNNSHILNGFALKIIALLIMTIDHIGAVLSIGSSGNTIFSEDTYQILRSIGRLSFPIFCFMIVEGFCYTKNIKKYLFRLICFAAVSQVPYSLAFRHEPFYLKKLNIFFTLALGLALISFIDWMIKKSQEASTHNQAYFGYAFVVLLACLIIADEFDFDYNKYGILLMLIFYFFRMPDTALESDKVLFKHIGIQAFFTFIITYLYSNDIQLYCLISFVFILMYNRKKGPSMKYLFYTYYPVHLLILYGIYMVL